MGYRDRGIPRWWRNKYWGANGECDWGEPAWPGWKKPVLFWESKWPVAMIITAGLIGWGSIPVFLVVVWWAP